MDQDRQSLWSQSMRRVWLLLTENIILWTVAIIAALVVALIIVLGYVREWEWTGLVKDKSYTKRTLWDWLQLLIIPAVLAGVGLWFNRQQREQELQTADRRAQDEALQAYLDQMSAMLLPQKDQPSLSDENPPESLRTVARARTLTVLPRLDADRKARVVQFLYESDLITKDRVIVDLKGAELIGAKLYSANLFDANLYKADLREAALVGAGLIDADLSGADLNGAELWHADLSDAKLSGANLLAADLRSAALGSAALGSAALSGADLNGARGWTEEQLDQAKSLDGATMPNGQKYEDWLKSKDRGEDGENSSS